MKIPSDLANGIVTSPLGRHWDAWCRNRRGAPSSFACSSVPSSPVFPPWRSHPRRHLGEGGNRCSPTSKRNKRLI